MTSTHFFHMSHERLFLVKEDMVRQCRVRKNHLPSATPPGRYVEDLELPGQKQDTVTYPVFVG